MFQTISEIAEEYGVSSKAVGKALYTLGVRDPDHPVQQGFPKEQYILHGIAQPVYTRQGELHYFTYDITTIRTELEMAISAAGAAGRGDRPASPGVYAQVCELEALLRDAESPEADLIIELREKIGRLKARLHDDDITLALPLDAPGRARYERLRAWRNGLAKGLDKPAYTIFGNKVLHAVAYYQPEELDELLAIKGVGDKKAERYGPEMLRIVNASETQHAAG